MSAVLNVSALTKRYAGIRRSSARVALAEVSFELAAGELVALVGPNGAGKTTLLSIIAGVQAPSAGTVAHANAGAPGWVPQFTALYSRLSAAENLELFARLEGIARPHAAVAALLELTGLAARAHEPVVRLSGGNRQRVNVALGLLSQAPVLALDEPSAALDPLQRERLWLLLTERAATGTAVLFSTHDVSEAQRHATRVLALTDGELIFDGPPEALMRAGGGLPGDDLERAFVRFLRTRT